MATMTAHNTHPDIGELVDWARGLLPRKRHREVWSHREHCPTCDMRLAKIIILSTNHRQQMKRRARGRRHLLIAASVVVLVGVAAGLAVSGYFSDSSSRLAELATTETIPEPHVHLRFGGSLPASSDLYEYRLKTGMAALVQQDYPLAVETLEDLFEEHAGSAEVAAYLGVARYLSGDNSDRTKALLGQGAQDMHDMISRAATWYLANSCLRSGDTEAAIQLLQSLDPDETDDRYARSSVDLLHQIQGGLSQ